MQSPARRETPYNNPLFLGYIYSPVTKAARRCGTFRNANMSHSGCTTTISTNGRARLCTLQYLEATDVTIKHVSSILL